MSAAVADDSVSEKSSMMWRDNLSSCSSIQQHHGGAGSLAGSSAAGGGGCSLGAGTTVVGPDGKVVRVKYIHIGLPTGCFRVRVIIHHPGISLTNGPILKPFEVVIVHSPRFCLVYLDGLCVGNYPSEICHHFWTDFGT